MGGCVSQASCHAVFWTQTYADGPWTAVSSSHPGPDEIWLVQSQVSPESQRLAITLHKQTEPQTMSDVGLHSSNGRSGRRVGREGEINKQKKIKSSWTETKTSQEDCFCLFKNLIIDDSLRWNCWSTDAVSFSSLSVCISGDVLAGFFVPRFIDSLHTGNLLPEKLFII